MHRVPSIIAALTLSACAAPVSPEVGGQTGEEVPAPCLEEREALAWDEVAPTVGTSAAGWTGGWPDAGWQVALRWADGADDTLSLEVEPDPTSATLVRRQPPAPDVDPADCPDLLTVEAEARWTTTGLSLTLATLLSSEGETATFFAGLEAPEDAYAAAAVTPPASAELIAMLEARVGPEGAEGTLSGFGDAEDDAHWVELARWPAPD